MKTPQKPLWKKSMLQTLKLDAVLEWLQEIVENGDMYGYEREEEGYYQEYKPLFDELAYGAEGLWEAMRSTDITNHWDDMTVALLGYKQKVLGYDAVEEDYYGMLSCEEDWATEEAARRIERMTKYDMLRCFRQVMTALTLFFDLKASHDCLTAIVTELDERGALLERKNDVIDRLYEDLTGKNADEFDRIVETLPQRMWVE